MYTYNDRAIRIGEPDRKAVTADGPVYYGRKIIIKRRIQDNGRRILKSEKRLK